MKQTLSLLIIWLFFTGAVSAQVVANFMANPTQGCSPLGVNFTNLSTGTGTLQYYWDFGNGNFSTDVNAYANYVTPGTYTVKLRVTNGIDTVYLEKPSYIRVFAAPQADFSSSSTLNGCLPLSIQFEDETILGDTIITSYVWDFNDGSTSSVQDPNHTYTDQGIYTVSLQVTDGHGCTDNFSIPNYVVATNKPDIEFVANNTTYCAAPFPVHFSNSSTGLGSLTYLWDFGDGTNSTQQNPNHTFTTPGTFDITLIVTNQYDCSDTLVMDDYISIMNIQAGFEFLTGDTGCVNVEITVDDTTNAGTLWSFGDGGSGTGVTENHAYVLPGNYTITLISAPGTICADTAQQVVHIYPDATASFTFVSPYTCGSQLSVPFTDTSPDAVAWSWSFGDSFGSTAQNPTHIFPGGTSSYTVELVVTDSHGCTGTSTGTILSDPPIADFVFEPRWGGCMPLDVFFTDTSYVNTTYDNIVSWQWFFGDGGTSNLQNPVHTYTDSGSYTVSLIITTAEGCTDSVAFEYVLVGRHITHQITVSNIVCAEDTLANYLSSIYPSYVDSVQWFIINEHGYAVDSFLDPQLAGSIFDTVGVMTLMYITTHNGCKDTTILLDTLVLQGAWYENLAPIMDCETPYFWGFYADTLKNITDYYWDFNGDNVWDSIAHFPGDTVYLSDTVYWDYPARGLYWVKLYTENTITGCSFKDSILIQVTEIIADLDFESPHCPANNLMNILGSQDAVSWTFDYGDGSPVTNVPLHTYPALSDTFNITFIARDVNGCTDTVQAPIRIFQPIADFVVSDTLICSFDSVQFTSLSYSDTTLITYFWNFGDGTSAFGNPINHLYANPGVYSISVGIYDIIGCSDTDYEMGMVEVITLHSDFTALDTTLCVGDSVFFNSDVPYADNYQWIFGDGDTLIQDDPVHFYSADTAYTVSLIVSNTQTGCIDTLTKPLYIDIQEIEAQFTVANTDTNCYPFPIDITNLTDTTYHPGYFWSFGDGTFGLQETPFHNYLIPGNMWLSLEVETPYGCRDRDSIEIRIGGPYAQLELSDSVICIGQSITFTLTDTMNISSLDWDFGDGGSADYTPVTHTFNQFQPGGNIISVIYRSGSCTQYIVDTVYILEVDADLSHFELNGGSTDTAFCSPVSLGFTNLSFGGTNYVWNYGNGTETYDSIPLNQTYSCPGPDDCVFDIYLAVASTIGCNDTAFFELTVHPNPPVAVGADAAICLGDSIQLSSSGGTEIHWTPATGLSDTTIYDPYSKPDSTTTYYVQAFNQFGCPSLTDSVTVFVMQVPVLTIMPDTTIYIGEYVDLMAETDQNFVYWQWSPDYTLTCTNCQTPTARPFDSYTYIVTVHDSMMCHTVSDTVYIEVIEAYSLDVPTAFTPDGDGINDKVYVRGWGLLSLIEFNIYNRWGELIYSSDDINEGWDGTYKGTAQNMDTYAYTVKVLTIDEKIMTKNGLINLLR